MSYDYKEQRQALLDDPKGMETLFQTRTKARAALELAGAFRADKVMAGPAMDAWTQLACLDYLVELGEIREIKQENCFAQHRIFEGVS